MGKPTFSQHHLLPAGRAIPAWSTLQPDRWVRVPVPEEDYDLDNLSTFIPLLGVP